MAEGRRGVCMTAVLWVIRQHWNDKLFNGRATSTDGVAYATKGLETPWPSKLWGEGPNVIDS